MKILAGSQSRGHACHRWEQLLTRRRAALILSTHSISLALGDHCETITTDDGEDDG